MPQPFLRFVLQATVLAWIAVTHAQAVAGDLPEIQKDENVDAAAMTRRVQTLREQGEYTKAIEAGRAAVSLAEKAFGADDPRTGTAKQALAAAYLEIDDKRAAVSLVREAIAIFERADPPDLIALSYAVGDLAQAVGSTKEAEPLYRKALALAEKVSGPEHPAKAHALNNLGMFLFAEGQIREAEPLMRSALRIRERAKGMADPLTAQSLCSLGDMAAAQGDISIAESLVRRSLDLRRLALPKGHPDIAESCSGLAEILLGQGGDHAREASMLAAEAFDISKKSHGPTAIPTLFAMHLKADAMALLGWQTESDRLHRDLIAKYETLPGPNLALLADALGEFGEHMRRAGKPDKAVELYRRAISIQRKAVGDDGAAVIAMRARLAEALYANLQSEDAVKEGRDILAFHERTEGNPQAATGVALYALAKYLLAVGRWKEAQPLLRRSISVLETTTGRGSRETLEAIYLLAATYIVTNELAEAERLVDDGLDRFAAQSDVRSGSAAGDLIGLRANIYKATGRIKEAEEADAVARKIHAEE